jgi:hypothetical protein
MDLGGRLCGGGGGWCLGGLVVVAMFFYITNSQKSLSLGGTIFSNLLYQLSGRAASNPSSARASQLRSAARARSATNRGERPIDSSCFCR